MPSRPRFLYLDRIEIRVNTPEVGGKPILITVYWGLFHIIRVIYKITIQRSYSADSDQWSGGNTATGGNKSIFSDFETDHDRFRTEIFIEKYNSLLFLYFASRRTAPTLDVGSIGPDAH